MVVRTLFLSAVVVTLGYADSFSSYCTITQGGVVIASNSFSTLLPEGPGAACPDVNFRNAFGDTVNDYTHFISVLSLLIRTTGRHSLWGCAGQPARFNWGLR